MYGLKRDIDLSFLHGLELIQVCISPYQIIFAFNGDVTISVEGHFSYFDGRGESTWKPELNSPHIAARTVALLGATITVLGGDENGTLFLKFSNGHRLTISDSSKEYESYQITKPGGTIVV